MNYKRTNFEGEDCHVEEDGKEYCQNEGDIIF